MIAEPTVTTAVTAAADDDAPVEPFVLIDKPRAAGHEFHFRSSATGRVYHVAPGRHPREPRFWCIWIHRCHKTGQRDDSEPSWLSDETMAREALADALIAARADIEAWIADVGGDPLRAWIDEPVEATA
jgi:hypothetical protein